MRILHEESDAVLSNVTLYLDTGEMAHLRDIAENLLADPTLEHCHLSSDDFQIEVTLVLIPEDISQLNERSQRVILENA